MAAPDAMQYQRSFMRVYDMGYAIPIDAEWNNVRRAWYAVVDRLEALRYERVYPQNLVLHMRFVGPGRGLLAASTGHELTCHIEMLTFHNTTRYAEFFLRIEREWRRFGGRPHWAKLSFDPARIGGLYPKQNLEKFMAIRAEMDPDELFLNDYLREVLGLL